MTHPPHYIFLQHLLINFVSVLCGISPTTGFESCPFPVAQFPLRKYTYDICIHEVMQNTPPLAMYRPNQRNNTTIIMIRGNDYMIGGWGVSPNREIWMAPVSVMPRLGFWSSISALGRGATFFSLLFALSLCARVLRKRYRFCSYAQGF